MKVSRKRGELFLVSHATVKARHSQALCNPFARPVRGTLIAPSLRKAAKVFNSKPNAYPLAASQGTFLTLPAPRLAELSRPETKGSDAMNKGSREKRQQGGGSALCQQL